MASVSAGVQVGMKRVSSRGARGDAASDARLPAGLRPLSRGRAGASPSQRAGTASPPRPPTRLPRPASSMILNQPPRETSPQPDEIVEESTPEADVPF